MLGNMNKNSERKRGAVKKYKEGNIFKANIIKPSYYLEAETGKEI